MSIRQQAINQLHNAESQIVRGVAPRLFPAWPFVIHRALEFKTRVRSGPPVSARFLDLTRSVLILAEGITVGQIETRASPLKSRAARNSERGDPWVGAELSLGELHQHDI